MEPLSPGARAALDAYRREHTPAPQALRAVQLRIAARASTPPSPPPRPRLRTLGAGALTVAGLTATLALRSAPPSSHSLSYEREHARLAPAPHATLLPAEVAVTTTVPPAAPAPAAPAPAAITTGATRARRPAPTPTSVPTSDFPVAPDGSAEASAVQGIELAEPTSEPGAAEAETVAIRLPAPRIGQSREDGSLDAEVMQLRTAYDLVRDGEPLRALSALREHAQRFPDGKLRELAEVARVLALCDAGQLTAARDAASSFARSYPSSIHKSRVREACR